MGKELLGFHGLVKGRDHAAADAVAEHLELRFVSALAGAGAVEGPERLGDPLSARYLGGAHRVTQLIQGRDHAAADALPVHLVLRLVVAWPEKGLSRCVMSYRVP